MWAHDFQRTREEESRARVELNVLDTAVRSSCGLYGTEPGATTATEMRRADVLLGLTTYSLSHTNTREAVTRAGGRVASMPGFEARMLEPGGPMAMTWGDALTSIVGGHWGLRGHTIWGHRRTWEGSITMFVVSLVVVALTLLVLPGSSLSPTADVLQTGPALLSALVAAGVATLAEAIAPAGTDNLSVPLLTSAALYLLL